MIGRNALQQKMEKRPVVNTARQFQNLQKKENTSCARNAINIYGGKNV